MLWISPRHMQEPDELALESKGTKEEVNGLGILFFLFLALDLGGL